MGTHWKRTNFATKNHVVTIVKCAKILKNKSLLRFMLDFKYTDLVKHTALHSSILVPPSQCTHD